MKFVSAAQNYKSGHFPDLLQLQKAFLDPKFKVYALATQNNLKDHEKARGTTFDFTFAVEPCYKDEGIHISPLGKKELPEMPQYQDLVQRAVKVMIANLMEHVMEESSSEHCKIRWAVKASITPGNEDNLWISSMQVNVSALKQPIEEALKKAGQPHLDGNENPTMYTVILFLGRYPQNYHPGYRHFFTTRMSVPVKMYASAIITGRQLHGSRGAGYYPAGYVAPHTPTPEEQGFVYPNFLGYGRVNLTGYPRNNCLEAASGKVSKQQWEPFALRVFGTMRNWMEWKMRWFIKEHIKVICPDPAYWCERFSWLENGIRHTPRLWIAQLCFEWAGKETPKYNALHKAILASGCGVIVPKPEGTEEKPKKPRAKRPKRAPGEPIVRVRCDGVASTGVRCQITFQPKADDSTRCGFHTKNRKKEKDAGKEE